MQLFKSYITGTTPYEGGSIRVQNKDHRKVYKLSSNENLLGSSPKALNSIRNSLSSLHEYNFQDDTRLREALECHFDYALNPGQFLTANSGMEILDLICRGFIEPGDNCIISTPGFLAYKSFAGIAGATVTDVPLERTTFALDVENILKVVTEKTKLIFISSPNNPTGSIVTALELDMLTAGLPKQVIIVYDEVYHQYVDDPGYARALPYIKQGFPIIGIHSFSKAYGLAGIRLGYAFGSEEIITYLRRLRRPFMINTLTMEAGIVALGDYEDIQSTRELVQQEKNWLYGELERYGISYWPTHANFILFRPPFEAKHFAQGMLQSGIMVRTGEVFGAEGFIRLTIGTREANNAFINVLKMIV